MNTITKKYYTKKDFQTVIIPSWQRWRNEKNVKDLAEAVSQQGQLRPILICVLPDGTKILTDGAHLLNAMTSLMMRKISVFEKEVKNEEEARRTFISFNTRGKTLSSLDYVVSYAGSGNEEYVKFLKDVLLSPKSHKEAEDCHGKLFSATSLMDLFLGKKSKIKQGNAKLPRNYNRLVTLVEYLGRNYLLNGTLLSHTRKNGSNMKLNGTTVVAIIKILNNKKMIIGYTDAQLTKILVDFTLHHYNYMISPSYTRDVIRESFKTYIDEPQNFITSLYNE